LTVEIHYDTSVFQRENVKRIARHFEALVRSAVQNPEAPVSELEILSASERQQLLIAFNQTSAEYPKDKCIHDLFEEQVERTPEAVAVVFEDQQLTYAECNARANQLARVLRQRGVAPDVRVGLCVERSVEMLVGLLGILKAGGAYVPLNPEHPKARLSQQLADIGSPVLITQEKLLSQLPDFEGEFICLDRDQELFESEQKTNPERIAAPHHLVYVIYTSGSTGVPKGVAISHRSLVNYTNFICRKLQLDGSSNADGLHFATVSTIGADLGNTCIFPSLVSGGCLHIIDYAVAMDGGAFANYVAKHPVDVLKIVPSHLSALLASPKSRNILPRKYLILGGEVLSWELIKQVSEISGDCQVINHYGPTETTVGSLTFDLRENDVFAQASTVPIGRPIANTEVYILDPHFKPMPIGVPGQLYISGVGLAQGYLNQPHQTAERFVPHPFSHEGSARLYKTGDLARYLPDGNVEFLGRTDHQVKIRGFRIELGEIEAVLKQHEAVRETVVLVREDEPGQERLVAYVVAHRKNASTVSELRSFLKEKLPEYMLPAAFVVLDGLPLTPNGKVDRKALPAPEDIRLELEATHVAPRTELEQNIAAVWQEALHVEKVGIHDSFFDLGGHSLLMVKVHNKLRGAMNKELSIIDMFRYPTVSSLASYLSGELNEEASSQAGHDRTETRRDLIKQQRQFRQERWQRKG
jgi:amino acid adenylation domain-containing protein